MTEKLNVKEKKLKHLSFAFLLVFIRNMKHNANTTWRIKHCALLHLDFRHIVSIAENMKWKEMKCLSSKLLMRQNQKLRYKKK